MNKELEIQGVKVNLKSNGALPLYYRDIIGRDFFSDFMKITHFGESEDFSFSEIYDIVYVLARMGGFKGSQLEWYEQFEAPVNMFSLWHEALQMIRNEVATEKK